MEVKANHSKHEFLHLFDKESYETFRYCATINQHDAGVAVKSDGGIVNVFKKNPVFSNALDLLIPLAIMNGGTHLDCYGEKLCSLYMQYGFMPIAKCSFDSSQADINWNYHRDGKPVIYFMILFSNQLHQIVSFALKEKPNFQVINYCIPTMSYEEGLEFQKRMMDYLFQYDIDASIFQSMLLDGFFLKFNQVNLSS